MASSLDIYPFHDVEGVVRFGVQTVVFLVGLFVAKRFIIAPALRLHNERKRRTQGSYETARFESEMANKLEHQYFTDLKKGAEEAVKMRLQEIESARLDAKLLIAEAQAKADVYIEGVKQKIAADVQQSKEALPAQVESLVSVIFQKIALLLLFSFLFFPLLHSGQVYAAGESATLVQSFWYSIFWPYFQFLCFILVMLYFSRRPIRALLEKRRDDLRAKLSEAKEALLLAERKTREYEAKIASLHVEIEELKQRNLFDAKIEREKIFTDTQKMCESILQEAEIVARDLIFQNAQKIREELSAKAFEEFEKRLTPENLRFIDAHLKKSSVQAMMGFHS